MALSLLTLNTDGDADLLKLPPGEVVIQIIPGMVELAENLKCGIISIVEAQPPRRLGHPEGASQQNKRRDGLVGKTQAPPQLRVGNKETTIACPASHSLEDSLILV
jgi:hypothetical protein